MIYTWMSKRGNIHGKAHAVELFDAERTACADVPGVAKPRVGWQPFDPRSPLCALCLRVVPAPMTETPIVEVRP